MSWFLKNTDYGNTASVRGMIVSAASTEIITIKVKSIMVDGDGVRPQIGEVVKYEGLPDTIVDYWNGDRYPRLKKYGDVYWSSITVLSQDEKTALLAEAKEKERAELKKKADAIPVDVLLESLKDRKVYNE